MIQNTSEYLVLVFSLSQNFEKPHTPLDSSDRYLHTIQGSKTSIPDQYYVLPYPLQSVKEHMMVPCHGELPKTFTLFLSFGSGMNSQPSLYAIPYCL